MVCGILYVSAKARSNKKKSKVTSNRVSLISDTKISQKLNNKNQNTGAIKFNKQYGKGVPSSSRLRYNRIRYLAPVVNV